MFSAEQGNKAAAGGGVYWTTTAPSVFNLLPASRGNTAQQGAPSCSLPFVCLVCACRSCCAWRPVFVGVAFLRWLFSGRSLQQHLVRLLIVVFVGSIVAGNVQASLPVALAWAQELPVWYQVASKELLSQPIAVRLTS